jgi:hypothetical protein
VGAVDVGEDAGGDREQHLAGRGQADGRAPLEQVGAEVGFEGVDLLAERGLGDADPVGRLGEVPQFGDGDERSQLGDLHSLRLSQVRLTCIGRIIEACLPSQE